MEENNTYTKPRKSKKAPIIIMISLFGALVLCAVLIAVLNAVDGNAGEFETYPPVDKLHGTYDEDFDIMEYDEYLGLDRTVYLNDKHSGVMQSVSDDQAGLHGKGFETVFYVIKAINAGDHAEYNRYMGDKSLEKGEFTQQQIYDIEISPESHELKTEPGKTYDEYILKVTYKIHENNGTYRNNVESDVSRAQYFYVNDSSGGFKVVKIVEPGYKK